MVDVAVLVIHAGVTPHALVQRAVETVGREKIVGVVLNRVAGDAFAEANYYEYYQSGVDQRRKGPQLLSTTRESST
jgi:Mrp family chromosome partitioning ATPase